MPLFLEHDDFYNEPVTLSETEREYPTTVFAEFFSKKSMSEVRYTLDNMMEACLTTDTGPFKDAEGRSKLISDHKDIEKVLEAALVIVREHREQRETSNYE